MRRGCRPCSWIFAALLVGLVTSGAARAGFIDHFAVADDVGVDKAPHLGRSRILVLPVVIDEPNLPPAAELVQQLTAFYDGAAAGFTFPNYFRQASLGRFDPVLEVGPVVAFDRCPFELSSSGRCTIARGDISVLGDAIVVLREILERVDAEVDFTRYDINGAVPDQADGVIDGIIIVSNIDFGGIAMPHYRLCGIGRNLCGGMIWDPTFDGVLVPWVAVAGSSGGDTGLAVRVSVHEFGHLLGFADLYDESGVTTDLPYSFMGGWRYDASAPMPDAFSRYVIGWANPVQAAGSGTYQLTWSAANGDVLKLGAGNEFFLVEARAPDGPWDADLQPGLAVYHVNLDKRPSKDSLSFFTTLLVCVNCDPWSPMIMLEQADGLFELQQGPGRRDDAGDLFRPGSTLPSAPEGPPLSASHHVLDSNTYAGASTGIAITRIVATADGYAVDVEQPALADPCADLLCPAQTTCQAGVCVVFPEGTAGCTCAQGEGGPWLAAFAVLALSRRRRRVSGRAARGA